MKKKFICTVCGYVHEGDEAPEKCPLCGAPAAADYAPVSVKEDKGGFWGKKSKEKV